MGEIFENEWLKCKLNASWEPIHPKRACASRETKLFNSNRILFKFMEILRRWRRRHHQFNCIPAQLTHSIFIIYHFHMFLLLSFLHSTRNMGARGDYAQLNTVEYTHVCMSSNICSQVESQPSRGQLISFPIHRNSISAWCIFIPFVFISEFFLHFAFHLREMHKQTQKNGLEEEKKSGNGR